MDYENIKKLIDDMGESKLSSLEVEFPDGTKIRMKKDDDKEIEKLREEKPILEVKNKLNYVNEESSIIDKVDGEEERSKDVVEYKYVKSPMVGTFYSKPSPNEESFIKIGQSINAGDTMCIIEAMKLMNEIESEFNGEVVEILKQDGDPVEYGEVLIKLK